MTAFSDSLVCTLFGHNPRKASLKVHDLDKADYEAIKRIYSARFNAAGDFDFYFTGAFALTTCSAIAQNGSLFADMTAKERYEGCRTA